MPCRKVRAAEVKQSSEVYARWRMHNSERASWQDCSFWRMNDDLDAGVRSVWPLVALDPGSRAANRCTARVARRPQGAATLVCHRRGHDGHSLRDFCIWNAI